MADLKSMKGLSDADRQLIEQAEEWLGAEPANMGPVKNLFWGNLKNSFYFPYHTTEAREQAECDQLIAKVDEYLRNEHPAIAIDQDQEIPDWVVKRLFSLGVLGMTIPKEYGGLGMGITSYNRVLERIGMYCGSTAVMVSAHQSIGCKAVMLYGNEQQKKAWLPHLAKDWLSAFCLSEPNVGCDAGGQETFFERDGDSFVITGEKKWATSGALSGLFTVMAKEKKPDGKGKVSAFVVHPWMDGVDIFQKNRSKCGIRGTWQARIRFTGVRVPASHLLGKDGRGLQMALSCLNYGRCTLSAGMLGGARRAMDQANKWSLTRCQFGAPLADKELVRQRLARMAAYCYAVDAVLYATTGMLDRKDEDHQVETAMCKIFCSELGWRVVNDAVQIMGGESYMTEHEVERIFRDSRINLIVEGANEVMQSYVFGYGGKQLAEYMLGVKNIMTWEGDGSPQSFGQRVGRMLKGAFNAKVVKAAMPLAFEVYLGVRRAMPGLPNVHESLRSIAERLAALTREHGHQFKLASKRFDSAIMARQAVQARLADSAMFLHGWACTLSKLDRDLKAHGGNGAGDLEFQRDKLAAIHFFDLAELEVRAALRGIYENADESMLKAADAVMKYSESQPAEEFYIPEKSQTPLRGKGKKQRQDGIKQFPGPGDFVKPEGVKATL